MALPAPFTPFDIGWDAPQLTAAERGVWSAFEWWYFDLSTDDGVEVVIVFSCKNPIFTSGGVSVYVEYSAAGTDWKHVRNYDASDFSFTQVSGVRELRIAGNVVRIVGNEPASMHYDVTLDLPWITAQLRMTPAHRGFLPTADGHYFTSRTDASTYTAVSFSAPIMNTTGSLTVNGATQQVSGRGYHDHPWGTQQLFWTHHEWHWGRTTTPGMGVMFATVTPAPEFSGALTFLWSGTTGVFEPQVTADLTVTPSAWSKQALLGIRFPHTLGVAIPGSAWTAQFQQQLFDMPMYERSAVSWTAVPPAETGSGWTEYFLLAPLWRWPAYLGAKVQAFFWRQFPWFGR